MEKNDGSAKAVRWIARISGTALVAITLLFGIGSFLEGFNKKGAVPFNTSLLIPFSIWGIGLVGLVWALWDEKKGGILSFVSFLVFVVLALTNPQSNSAAPVLIIFLFPPTMYLIYWFITKETKNSVSK